MEIKKSVLKKIAVYIHENFEGEEVELAEYIFQISSDISYIEDEEKVQVYLNDIGSKEYQSLVEIIKELIDKNGNYSRIEIKYSPPVYYIKQTLFSKQAGKQIVEEYIRKLDYILKCDSNAGEIYEEFCCECLREIGISCRRTPYVGDDGIDIIGEIQYLWENTYISKIVGEQMYILGQAKFYNNKVDVSVVRHLVGDGLYYKFSNSNIRKRNVKLLVIAHNGFTQSALELAEMEGVSTITSRNIIELLLNKKSVEDSKALRYIRSI